MIKYIKITRYCNADILDEIRKVIDNGLMDEDTRLFFANNNHITTNDIAKLYAYFDIVRDLEFDMDNILFKPKEHLLKRVEKNQKI